MGSAMQLAVDPHLVCLPSPCTSEKQIEDFVECLLGWKQILDRPDTQVVVADVVRIALFEDEEYPYPHRLRELLRRFHYDVVDHETICRVANHFLESMPSLEDSLGVRCVIYDDGQVEVQPKYLKDRLSQHTQSAFVEMLVLWVVGKQIGPVCDGVMALASSPSPANTEEADEVFVQAEVHEVEWADTTWVPEANMPCSVEDRIMLADCYRSLGKQLGIWTLWNRGDDPAGALDAIEVVTETLIVSGVDGGGKREYRLGACFLPSAKKWGFGNRADYASLLVESCARIVLAIPKNPVTEFWESSGSQRQRVRNDGAKAFRTHLTKKGDGFRLMLWELPDGSIEFANVGDKDELVIL